MTAGPVLQLCSDYAWQRLYARLFAALHDVGVAQAVYVPVRGVAELAVAAPPRPAIAYYARHVLRKHHRIFFRSKVRSVAADVAAVVAPASFALVHAHFLYSDGAVALRLHERFGTPFVVAVRNTDLNVFWRLRPDLRPWMYRILRAARGVVFLSPAYRAQFLERLPAALAAETAAKCSVIPNGIGPEWLAPLGPPPRAAREPLRVLYVGNFSRNKNVLRLIDAVGRLAERRSTTLTLVGGGGEGAAAVEARLAAGRDPWVRFVGPVHDADRLRVLYGDHDILAMPSIHETFGLVYIEALSQGLPVLCSVGQGVDGYFPAGGIAEAVNPRSVADIARGLEALAGRADSQRDACRAAALDFAWPRIATVYRELYASAVCSAGGA